ncbi:MAG: hypothetical protein GC208_10495 [Alphaproteobacteria bacterium]|nr:hypothetical protein [Alphaproteobacteria bacterium]
MKAMTGAQAKFLANLLTDVRTLFFAGKPEAGERDVVNWMGGFLRKHITRISRLYTTWEEIQSDVNEMSSGEARALIAALADVRKRMDAKLPRTAVATPRQILPAIWKAAKLNGHEKQDVEVMVNGITNGETTSTKHLRREEALTLLRRLGGETRVFEIKPGGGFKNRKGAAA